MDLQQIKNQYFTELNALLPESNKTLPQLTCDELNAEYRAKPALSGTYAMAFCTLWNATKIETQARYDSKTKQVYLHD